VDPRPTLVEVRAYLGVGADQLPDDQLERIYGAAQIEQAQLCRQAGTPDALAPEIPFPLAQALLRRVQREVAAKSIPLGLVGPEGGDFGPTQVPYFDSLVEGHERGYRRVVLG
jgi:hypothetical protein